MLTKSKNWLTVALFSIFVLASLFAPRFQPTTFAQTPAAESAPNGTGALAEVQDISSGGSSDSVFVQAMKGGFIVVSVLLILVIFSVLSWAILVWKLVVLRKHTKASDSFIKSFWDSRSLNDLNSRLGEYPASPAKEVFRTGYAELVRGSQLKESLPNSTLAVNAAMDNINRSLAKAKRIERKKLESLLPLLATIASAAPFIGLFGTVWGIMNSFQDIARTGNASLNTVAPGISEALIATAFGLAAAIPAVIAFNASNTRIRALAGSLDGFSMDFLNIVGRYLVSDRKPGSSTQAPI